MVTNRVLLGGIVTAFGLTAAAHAGVVVSNLGSPATYSGTPTIIGNPSVTLATVGDGGGGGAAVATQVSGTTVVVGSGQMFTAPAIASDITQVEFRFLGAPGGLATLHLYRLVGDANSFPLTLFGSGTDLLGGGSGLAVTGISNASVNNYAFALNNTGTTDQVSLVPSAAYLISLTTSDGSGLIYRYGGADSLYAGGTGVFNGGNAPAGNRDTGFAITTVASTPEPVVMGLMGLVGIGLTARRRRA